MSYHIYSSDGIILKRTPIGEANIYVHVLTRELGLIIASAQSARLSTSKLSSALTEYSLVSLSVIKAKRGWKITDARAQKNYYFNGENNIDKSVQAILAQLSTFLLKMIPGEEPHVEIYDTILSGFEFLSTVHVPHLQSESSSHPTLTSAKPDPGIKSFESIAVLRILYHLGYVVKNTDTETFLTDTTTWNKPLLASAAMKHTTLVRIINHSLKESHL